MQNNNPEITPWNVNLKMDSNNKIDYDHIINTFGCQKFDQNYINLLHDLTHGNVHLLFRRHLCFAHRDFDKILEVIKTKKPFYIYTGRGPSSSSMHLGHTIPFLLCKYFQDVFNCPLVIQITDDEKFIFKNMLLDDAIKYGIENIKDIIALGFNPKLTYIFSNYNSSSLFEYNTLRISKVINLNEALKIFGFDLTSNIGMIQFPAKEIAPAFPTSFPFLDKDAFVLIPSAVDQDPFFRLARDKANSLNEKKPTTLYVDLLPSLKGIDKKMSASDATTSIYLSDTPQDIENKIKKHAFSGGQPTKELQEKLGANIHVDVPYQYLKFFLEDDDELNRIGQLYSQGKIMTSDVKNICIQTIQKFIAAFQERRSKITEDILNEFMTPNKQFNN